MMGIGTVIVPLVEIYGVIIACLAILDMFLSRENIITSFRQIIWVTALLFFLYTFITAYATSNIILEVLALFCTLFSIDKTLVNADIRALGIVYGRIHNYIQIHKKEKPDVKVKM